MLEELRFGRTNLAYNDILRSFALTLHFYSPAAYEYVRKKFGNHLPSQRTLRNWYQNVNGEPGISTEALETLKLHVQTAKKSNKPTYVALMLDGMHIRKQIIWNAIKKNYIGYVDYGLTSDTGDNQVEATSALVFLISGINARFKIPVAYYFTNTMTAEEQAQIIREILVLVHDAGADLLSIVFDGARVNIKTAMLLGGELWDSGNLKKSFVHPCSGKQVHFIIDICHAMKLVRNVLGTKGKIFDGDGKEAKWDHVVRLEQKQSKEAKLHSANKLTRCHIQFDKNKMQFQSCRSAVQTC